jgi:hypothetical protein
MPDLADTIRDRVYVALARALGDEEAAATGGEGDLITIGTFDGHPVHLEFGVDVVLRLEEADYTLVQLDVSEQPPPASSRAAYRQAYQVALEAVGARFLPAKDHQGVRIEELEAELRVSLQRELDDSGADLRVGERWLRDPDAPCEAFEPGTPGSGDCETDGHYLCEKCSEMSLSALREDCVELSPGSRDCGRSRGGCNCRPRSDRG